MTATLAQARALAWSRRAWPLACGYAAALCMVLLGLVKGRPEWLPRWPAPRVTLEAQVLQQKPDLEELARWIDISDLGIEDYSDATGELSPALLFEAGRLLNHTSDHRKIRGQRGWYSHWKHNIFYSPSLETPHGAASPVTLVYPLAKHASISAIRIRTRALETGVGGIQVVDLAELDIALADPAAHAILLEAGVPLAPWTPESDGGAPGFAVRGSELHYLPAGGAEGEEPGLTLLYLDRRTLEAVRPALSREKGLWRLCVVLALLAAFGLRGRLEGRAVLAVRLALCAALATAVFFSQLPRWSLFYVARDSSTYVGWSPDSVRDPAYPLFVRLASGGDLDLTGYEMDAPQRDRRGDPVLRVVQGQKLLRIAALAAVYLALSGGLSPPLVAVALFWISGGLLLNPVHDDSLMTEAFVQSLMLALVAVFFQYTRDRRGEWLPVAALLAAGMYLTRPAAVYAAGFLGAMLLQLAWGRRWKQFPIFAASLALLVALALTPPLLRMRAGEPSPMAPLYQLVQIGWALQFAQPADIGLMPDAETREFLERALVKRDELRRSGWIRKGVYQELSPSDFNGNLYRVAKPVAAAIGTQPHHMPELFARVSAPLRDRYRAEYRSTIRQYLAIAFEESTRLRQHALVWWLFLLAPLLALVSRSAIGFAGLVCVLGHVGHLLVVCLSQPPLKRFVYATESLAAIGLLALVPAAAIAGARGLRLALPRMRDHLATRKATRQRHPLLAAVRIISGNLLLCGFVLAFGLAGVEGWYRYREPLAAREKTLQRDPELGWDSIPPVQVVAQGTGGPTIAFVGDSFTHSTLWPSYTIDELRRRGRSFDGYSLGVAGHGTIQTWLKIQRHIDRYKPDVVALLFFAWNDMRDNFGHPGIYYNPQTRIRPFYSVAGDALELERPFVQPELISGSRIYERLVLNRAHQAMRSLGAEHDLDWVAENRLEVKLPYGNADSWTVFYRKEHQDGPYVAGAWKATERALADLHRLLSERGSRFLVFGIDNAFTVDPDVFERWVEEPAGFDPTLPLERLARVSERLGIEYVNCLPMLLKLRQELDRKVYNGPPGNLAGHFEPQAESALAQWVADVVLAETRSTF